jgi:hypothetical protein
MRASFKASNAERAADRSAAFSPSESDFLSRLNTPCMEELMKGGRMEQKSSAKTDN